MARQRKTPTPEHKLAVKMITDQKLSVAEAARRPGISENRLYDWKKAHAHNGPTLSPAVATPHRSKGRTAS